MTVPVVRTQTYLWSTLVAQAEAADVLDAAQAGQVAVMNRQPYPRAYEFSNGRTFKDGGPPRAE